MRIRSAVGVLVLAIAAACKYPALPDLPDTTDAAIDAMTCTQTTCEAGVLRVCGPGGTVDDTETCLLGCFSQTRCAWVDPSNGLGSFLDTAAAQDDITLPQGANIDTDSGMVHIGAQMIPVTTDTIAQPVGPMLRVFVARSWTINDVRIQGTLPIALIGIGDVRVLGIIDASADGAVGGPGAATCDVASGIGAPETYGYWTRRNAGHDGPGMFIWNTNGAGGGGFGGPGAKGGDMILSTTFVGGAGGLVNGTATLVPLRGGCSGGKNGFAGIDPGAGGGAIQIVSGAGSILVGGGAAGVQAGGGGGRGCDNGGTDSNTVPFGCGSAGGGSGGGILLEAAHVRLGSSSRMLAAGGGGGGTGGCGELRHGQDAPASAAVAGGGACPVEAWGQPPVGGAGGAGTGPQPGMDTAYFTAGSGGGGLGRIRINTSDATFEGEAAATIRGVVTTGTVTTR